MTNFYRKITPGAMIDPIGNAGWRLSIPGGPAGIYRCSQIDDYSDLERNAFPWKTGVEIRLTLKVSCPSIPGTWGFGFWNDPFNAKFSIHEMSRRFPILPESAWFFYASKPNYLSLRDNQPANGFMAATFTSPLGRGWLVAGIPLTALLFISPVARLLRKMARLAVRQSTKNISVDPTELHDYRLLWDADRVFFHVDQELVSKTPISPRGRMGFLAWIDNQYAYFNPDGRFGFGTLSNSRTGCLEIASLQIVT